MIISCRNARFDSSAPAVSRGFFRKPKKQAVMDFLLWLIRILLGIVITNETGSGRG